MQSCVQLFLHKSIITGVLRPVQRKEPLLTFQPDVLVAETCLLKPAENLSFYSIALRTVAIPHDSNNRL